MSNGEVVCSPAARSTCFAESTFVLLIESAVRVEQQPVWAAVMDLAVLSPLPSRRVAAHVQEVSLPDAPDGYFVFLSDHVLRVLLVS